jgi:methylase of polypeptide subunit release factors
MQTNILTDEKNFYPTPERLVKKMLNGIKQDKNMSVLEPSAGTGNIAEVVKSYLNDSTYGRNRENLDIDCIEIDENLRSILKGKELRVVHDDFLTYNTRKQYDLIIMNPPFDNGDRHLLKALQMQEHGGKMYAC